MTVEALPYWLVNVPKEEWPSQCPDFLANVNTKDRGILATPDAQYRRQSWPEVQHFIKTNRIDLFQRVPSEMRRYLAYNAKLGKEYGSVMNFVVKERLHWSDLTPQNQTPFCNPDDIKILYNDWPYGVDDKIVHLVVWTKFELEDDPATDDLTDTSRRQIDDYVNKTFCEKVSPKNVIWFKNWKSLKSIHSVEHFHVMLCDPDPRFIEEITNGDVPLSAKV